MAYNPLTVNILNKFDLESEYGFGEPVYWSKKYPKFELVIRNNDEVTYEGHRKITTVEELQTLFSSITGEQLNFKP